MAESKWAINLDCKVLEILEVVIAEIRAKPTHVMGWFQRKLAIAWRNIFRLTEDSARLGFLPLTDPTWGKMLNSWWQFLVDDLSSEEE